MQLRVIQDSDNLGVGNINAQVGMELANAYRIVKVHSQSVIAENHSHRDKLYPQISIYYTEAVRWRFTNPAVDDYVEQLAAIRKKFQRGEAKFVMFERDGYVLPLDNPIEQAGYDFGKEIQAKRELAIAALLEAKAALSKQEE